MITLNSCGYNSHHRTPLDFHFPHGHPDYTLLLIKTDFFLEWNGHLQDLPAGTGLLLGRSTPVRYGRRQPGYNDDWFHFELSGPDDGVLDALGLVSNCPFLLTRPTELDGYGRLITAEFFGSRDARVLDALMHALFFAMAGQLRNAPVPYSSNRYYRPMCQLRLALLNAPAKPWQVQQAAQTLHLSVSHFQHLYKAFFGRSYTQEHIAARIQMARRYLHTTDLTVRALAELCGYGNELHFMRQFKQQTGMTPSQYRNLQHGAAKSEN